MQLGRGWGRERWRGGGPLFFSSPMHLPPLPPKKGESWAYFSCGPCLEDQEWKPCEGHDRNSLAFAKLHWQDCWLPASQPVDCTGWWGNCTGWFYHYLVSEWPLPCEWPYGDEIIRELAPSAIKQVLFACPRALQRPLLQPSQAPCLQWNAANINKRSLYIPLSSPPTGSTLFSLPSLGKPYIKENSFDLICN